MESQPSGIIRPGDVFAIPLNDGRSAVVRVLRTVDDTTRTSALVAVTPWLGERLPDIEDPLLRQILRQHRGFYTGKPAICWYEGDPPSDFVYLGRIQATAEELALDPMGCYGGPWHWTMARGVVLEEEWRRGRPHREIERGRTVESDVDRVTGAMADHEFWDIIALLDWRAEDDESIIERLLEHLAELPPDRIAGFHRVLCEKLYQLDREEFAREIGECAYGSEGGFSPDHFLDARCAVVANGKEFYEEVLSNPRNMPKNLEFERLLSVAEQAYRRRTGRVPIFVGAREVETFSNSAGWKRAVG